MKNGALILELALAYVPKSIRETIWAIANKPRSTTDLARILNISKKAARQRMRVMRKKSRLVFIAKWVVENGQATPYYRLGEKADAPKPVITGSLPTGRKSIGVWGL